MPILHKNITNSTDIHNPKWLSTANNGDYAWKNEKGELESIDEIVLPAALNFVNASVAPPTSNNGDIYILSSGGSVNAGWGSVSVGDWVKYDGALWNSITPQKSSLCYDKTADSLKFYDGSLWAALGGDSIYTADGTLTGNRIVDLGNSNDLTFDNSGSSSNFKINAGENGYSLFNRSGGLKVRPSLAGNQPLVISNTSDNFNTFTIKANGGGDWSAYNGVKIGELTLNDYAKFTISALDFFNSGVLTHSIGFENNGSDVYFQGNGITQNNHFSVGGKTRVLTESISLQGETLIKGAGTSTGVTLSLYNNDSTPVKNIDFLDNGRVKFLNLPTSSTGLSSGDVYNDGGTLKIV